MSNDSVFRILTEDGKEAKFLRKDLIAHSDYFRALFSSGMQESKEGKVKLNKSTLESVIFQNQSNFASPFNLQILNLIMTLLVSNESIRDTKHNNYSSRSLARHFCKRIKDSDISNLTIPGCQSPVARWLLKAEAEETEEFLNVVGYFQFHGIVDQVIFCDEEKQFEEAISIEVALRVLPYARKSGLLKLFKLSIQSVLENYLEFLRFQQKNASVFEEPLLLALQQSRLGVNENKGPTVVLRTDTTYDDNNCLRISYAVVEFSFSSQSNATSSVVCNPRLIETFNAGPNEVLCDAVTINNYLYLITSQYCLNKKETYFRIHRLDPQACRTIYKKPWKESPPQVAACSQRKGETTCLCKLRGKLKMYHSQGNKRWSSETTILTKPGKVHNCHAMIAQRNPKRAYSKNYVQRFIYLLGGISSKDTGNVLNQTMDRYDPIKSEWTSCANIPLSSSHKASYFKTHQDKGVFEKRKSLQACESLKISPSQGESGGIIRIQMSFPPKDDYSHITSGSQQNYRRCNSFSSSGLKETEGYAQTERNINENVSSAKLYSYDAFQDKWKEEKGSSFVFDIPSFKPVCSSTLFTQAESKLTLLPYSSLSSTPERPVTYCLRVDKTNRIGADAVTLEKFHLTCTGEILEKEVVYRLSACNLIQSAVCNTSSPLKEVENLLLQSSIAVPHLFSLYFPNTL